MNQIQWFPGHMAKARRQVEEKLKLVDIVFELLDARIPISSENPMLQDIIKDKPRLVILNKADLSDERENKKWVAYYESLGLHAIAIDSLNGNPLEEILRKSREILTNLFVKEKQKGMKVHAIKAMVLGIPNVGKSQFINRLAGKNKAKTGDKPGITKMQLYLRAGDYLELLDNPGILWPKFESKEVALHLALVGSIKEDVLPIDEVTLFGIDFLRTYYPKKLSDRYALEEIENKTTLEILDLIGLRRGCLLKGNEIDYERVFKLFLYDFRTIAFGRISIEQVNNHV
ncbi:MAG: ribosome biogenesis GTPase YlqF [Candidatus Izemoplasmatales bacterium]|nr:ribosome biogenesis GTPase YlqF [Candidatus Izemoplasmatales bacterium]